MPITKNITLCLEGSTANYFSISLFSNTKILQEVFYQKPQFSNVLLPTIKSILEKNNIKKESLKAIFTTSGPGSFTSIRVVLSSLLAISFGLKIPLYTLDSLKTAALSFKEKECVVILKAYKNQFYFAYFKEKDFTKETPTNIEILQGVQVMKNIENKNCYLVGDIEILEKDFGFISKEKQKIKREKFLLSSNLAYYLSKVKDIKKYQNTKANYIQTPDTKLPY